MHFLPARSDTFRKFRRGISLHGHTQHSREGLGFIDPYIDTVPIVAQIARHAMARYRRDHGEELDFNRAYWTAPLTAADAHHLERNQIEDALGLEGVVSITDHDNIDAARETPSELAGNTVVSLEWTVPYRPGTFHLGVHNLPRSNARAMATSLFAYTRSPDESRLPELLATLDRVPQVLTVLNHPFWEMEPIGKAAQLEMLNSFLRSNGRYVHALEVSGLRPWGENQQVLNMAESLGMAVVSGGDRHGWEASTMLNLTRACCFSEFAAEIRQDGQNEIVVMPNYQEPFGLRMMQVAWDVLRDYPAHPCGRTHWTDRVFFECDDEAARPLSSCFQDGEPQELRFLTGAMRQLEKQPWRGLLRTAWSCHPTHTTIPPKLQTLRPAARPAFTSGEGSIA